MAYYYVYIHIVFVTPCSFSLIYYAAYFNTKRQEAAFAMASPLWYLFFYASMFPWFIYFMYLFICLFALVRYFSDLCFTFFFKLQFGVRGSLGGGNSLSFVFLSYLFISLRLLNIFLSLSSFTAKSLFAWGSGREPYTNLVSFPFFSSFLFTVLWWLSVSFYLSFTHECHFTCYSWRQTFSNGLRIILFYLFLLFSVFSCLELAPLFLESVCAWDK